MTKIIFFGCLIIIIVIFIIYNINTGISKYTVLCHANDYKFIKEYIDTIFKNNKLILYNDSSNIIDDNVEYLCIRRPPKFMDNYIKPDEEYKNVNIIENNKLKIIKLVKKSDYDYGPRFLKLREVGILNLEHLTCSKTYKILMKYIYPYFDYYDYSQDNINIYGKGTLLLYSENKKETLLLKKLLNVEKKYDIIFNGSPSIRRDTKISELINKGIKIKYLKNTFGHERDTQIGEGRILLNIHSENDWLVYESLRCERWRFAGMPIISEYCISKLPEGITGCSYDDIYDTIILLLQKLKSI